MASERPTPLSATRQENRPLSRLLSQQKVPDAIIMVVLAIALLFGLVGFAAHVAWVISIVVIALGLGYIVANSRRDRKDVGNRRLDNSDAASTQRP